MSELDVVIKLKAVGLDDMKDDLKNIRKRMDDLRPVWPKVNASLKKYLIENFTAQGLPSGGWKPLEAEYGSWKSARFPGAPLLVQSGALFAKVVKGPDLDGGKRGATFSFGGEIAKFHQYGTTKMAKREIIFSPELWEKDVAKMVEDYIIDGII